MTDLVVVKSKLHDVAKGYNIAGDLAEALDKRARESIQDACKRAGENNRKTVMAKDVGCCFVCPSSKEMLVVRSKIKDVAKGYNVAGDFADVLNNVLVDMVKEAAKRADGNNRKTVMGKDL